LEALTWIAQGLKGSPEEAGRFIEGVVRPVIECFSDSDQKIKYTAIKSLYYICKFLEEVIVRMFNVIFEAVLRRMSDPDDEIKNAAELLNGTLKTIISDALSDNIPFELTKFMGIITEHLGDPSSNTRGFLIDWINTIDEVPSIDLSIYLPSFLEDVLFMLGDKEKELRMKAE
jgi:vacuole morphology and inheritance protein 14